MHGALLRQEYFGGNDPDQIDFPMPFFKSSDHRGERRLVGCSLGTRGSRSTYGTRRSSRRSRLLPAPVKCVAGRARPQV